MEEKDKMVNQNEPMVAFSSQVKRCVSVDAYKVKFDEGETYTYVGKAKPGADTSDASWQIKRITNADGNIDWAGGDIKFTNIWDNRASLSYS